MAQRPLVQGERTIPAALKIPVGLYEAIQARAGELALTASEYMRRRMVDGIKLEAERKADGR